MTFLSLRNLRIRAKLLLAFGSLLIISTALIITFFSMSSRLAQYQNASEGMDALTMHVLDMENAINYFVFEGYKEPAFYSHGSSTYLNQFKKHEAAFAEGLGELALPEKERRKIENRAARLTTDMQQLAVKLQQRGFKDNGLEGALRAAIHRVENASFPYDKVTMLMLRRHEKDFFLRKDLKYMNDFSARIEVFLQQLKSAPPSVAREATIKQAEDYHSTFLQIVAAEEAIGLTDSTGLKGAIQEDLAELKGHVSQLRGQVRADLQAFRQRNTTWLMLLFAGQLALGIGLAIAYANSITRTIKEIYRAITDLAKGTFPLPLQVNSQEELGKTRKAFNLLVDRIRAATTFAGELGAGQLNAHYDPRFQDDILARTLTRLKDQLATAEAKQTLINWSNQGAARINDLIKDHGASHVTALSDSVLKMLVQCVKANQGALYLLKRDDEQEYLDRVATFAYGKKKFVDQRVSVGTGLAGQCILDRATIVLKEIPPGYVKITSGLGEATPRFVALIPLRTSDHVMGVLELASFNELMPHEIQFLETMGELVGSLLFNRQRQEQTDTLLAQARMREQQMALQEEEMRQQAEEMQAVQEQMQRQQKELLDEIARAKKPNHEVRNQLIMP